MSFELLGFRPNKIDLYELALIHRSASIPCQNGISMNNERLEFLGDAILGSIIADMLYKYFPNKNEGFLTQVRSKIVSRESLNRLALAIGLDKQVMSNVSLNNNKHIYGDAFEALVGAIFLDQGYAVTKVFIEDKIFRKYINIEKVVRVETNFKSKLIEWAQKNKREVVFDTHENGLDDVQKLPVFLSEVEVDGTVLGRGLGASKKESQQMAAKEALLHFEEAL